MLAFINILGVLGVLLLLSIFTKESVAKVTPIMTGLLMMGLYLFAILGRLHLIIIIDIAAVALLVVLLILKKTDIKAIASRFDMEFIVLASVVIVVAILSSGITAWHNDELGAWALEAKSIFLLDGFEARYCNAAPSYGKYFPGQMLLEAWFAELVSMKEFKEGALYSCYYGYYIMLLAPVFKLFTPSKKRFCPVSIILTGFMLLITPSVFDMFGYEFLSAEFLLSAAFAILLYCIFTYKDRSAQYNVLCFTTLLFQMCFIKETGFYFGLLAISMGMIVNFSRGRGLTSEMKRSLSRLKAFLWGIFTLGIPTLGFISWKLYCRYTHRYNFFDSVKEYVSNEFTQGASENSSFSEFNNNIISSFFKTLYSEPLHYNRTVMLDITVLMCIVITALILYLCFREEQIRVRIIAVVSYLVVVVFGCLGLLYAHIFLFREDQYFNTPNMVMSISRYLQPILMGIPIAGLLLLLHKNIGNIRIYIFVMVAVMLCADYATVYDRFFDGSESRATMESAKDKVYADFSDYIEEVRSTIEPSDGRILYVSYESDRDVGAVLRVLPYELAPYSMLVYGLGEEDADSLESLIRCKADERYCRYVYVDSAYEVAGGFPTNTLIKLED